MRALEKATISQWSPCPTVAATVGRVSGLVYLKTSLDIPDHTMRLPGGRSLKRRDGPKDLRTDGHTLLKRCLAASKNVPSSDWISTVSNSISRQRINRVQSLGQNGPVPAQRRNGQDSHDRKGRRMGLVFSRQRGQQFQLLLPTIHLRLSSHIG